MNFKPILFSTPMVRAILEDRKTMTRRKTGLDSINEDSGYWNLFDSTSVDSKGRLTFDFHSEDGQSLAKIHCPYGNVGDVLWVRETWCPWYNKSGYFYAADQKYPDFKGGQVGRPIDYDERGDKWKPSINMPKAACRIFLEITDIRVERLQDISEDDCLAEGVKVGDFPNDLPSVAFFGLWRDIHGEGSWNNNPWVWVVSFKRIERPDNLLTPNK